MFTYFFFVVLMIGFVTWLGSEPEPSDLGETYADSSYVEADSSLEDTQDPLCCDPGAPPPLC